MSDRIDKNWTVLNSIQDKSGLHCVDIFSRPNGTFGFEEFRRDPEDQGRWTGIKYYSQAEFHSEEQALESAIENIIWLSLTEAIKTQYKRRPKID